MAPVQVNTLVIGPVVNFLAVSRAQCIRLADTYVIRIRANVPLEVFVPRAVAAGKTNCGKKKERMEERKG